MAAPLKPTHARRDRYAVPLHGADYFIVRHLGRFLTAQIAVQIGHGDRVADIGCGEQPLRHAIEERGGRYIGVDVTRSAGAHVAALASAMALPFRAGTIDVVCCTEVLEHVPDATRAFAELARLLAPGGRLIVTVPFLYPLHEEPHDFVRLTDHRLRALGHLHGLDVVLLERRGTLPEVLATLWARAVPPLPRRPGGGRPLRAAINASLRLVGNALAALCGRLGIGRDTAAYLSTVAVFTRQNPAH